MYINRSIKPLQQRIKHYVANRDPISFFNQLTSIELNDIIEPTMPAFRDRLYPPTETLSMFLAQALNPDRSCQNIVNQVAIKHQTASSSIRKTNTGAYCKARKRLPLEMVSTLVRQTGNLITSKSHESWLWNGKRIRLVDGTTVTLPDTSANQAAYPQQSGQKLGLGFPICRIVVVTCLASGAVINAAMGGFKGKGSSEQNLLRTLLDSSELGDMMMVMHSLELTSYWRNFNRAMWTHCLSNMEHVNDQPILVRVRS